EDHSRQADRPEDGGGGGVHRVRGDEPESGEKDAKDLFRRDRHRPDGGGKQRGEREKHREAADADARAAPPAPGRERHRTGPLRDRRPHRASFASKSCRASWLTASPTRGPIPSSGVSSSTTILFALPAGVRESPGTLHSFSGPPRDASVRSVTRRTSGCVATSASVLMGR